MMNKNPNLIDYRNYYGILRFNNQIQGLDRNINIVGRSPSCNIILNHASISKEHCAIEFNSKGDAFLKDLGALNNTYVNAVKVMNNQTVQIFTNDKIKFGADSTTYVFENCKELNSNRNLDDTRQATTIRDDRVSLVSQDYVQKATRNHFARNNQEANRYHEADIKNNEDKKNKDNLRINTNPSVITGGSVVDKDYGNISPKLSPKFNTNHRDDNDDFNNVTFKKGGSIDFQEDKGRQISYDEMVIKVENLTNANLNLEKKNVELEEKLLKITNDYKKLNNQFEQVNDEYSKLSAKNNNLLIFASDLQRKVDLLEADIGEKNEELSKFKTLDWGKLIIERDNQIKILTNDLTHFRGELNNIKTNLLNEQKGGGYTNEMAKRTDTLLDNFLSENKKLKKILDEYKTRENECTKKWNELLKENNLNIERNNLLHQQLNDQNESFNNMIADFDKRLVESLSKIPQFFENYDMKKAEAARYLVEQMNVTTEEKRKLIEENNLLLNQVNMMQFENDKLKQDYKTLSSCFEVNSPYNSFSVTQNNASSINVKQLKNKIEELEDLITQQKNINSPSKIIELQETIASLTVKLEEKQKEIDYLYGKHRDHIKRSKNLFDESQAVNSLQNALRTRDIQILNLQNNLKELKNMERIKTTEIDNLSRILEKQNDNQNSKILEDYSSKDKGYNSNMFIEKIENFS